MSFLEEFKKHTVVVADTGDFEGMKYVVEVMLLDVIFYF